MKRPWSKKTKWPYKDGKTLPVIKDITEPQHGVQVQVRGDGQVLWVHVDGVTVLRICRVKNLEIQDDRPAVA
jgi:hypothetical protein